MDDRLSEFGRISLIFRPLAAKFPGALKLSDDAALLDLPSGKELVVTTDAIVAGVHFLPTDTPGDIARKALRVNLSDLAAKGALPLAYTLTLALSRKQSDGWVVAFADGLAADQAEYGIELAGGDSVSTEGPIWVSITAFGLVDAGRMVKRSGARLGDIVLVTGTIGDAALGLAVEQGRLVVNDADRAALVGRYRLPQPRTHLAKAIAAHAHAAIDISDGLAADFGHLCRVSQVIGQIEVAKIPQSAATRRAIATEPKLMAQLLGGGDDYEVLLAAPLDAVHPLRVAAEAVGIDLTVIGAIVGVDEMGRADLLDDDGNRLTVKNPGWTHS